MSTVAVEKTFTPEELLTLGNDRGFELVNGRLVEKSMGAEASLVGINVATGLRSHVRKDRQGLVFGSECGYQIFADDPNRIRKPDVSFVRRGRLPDDRPPRGYIRIPPDFLLEVVSPNDIAEDIHGRLVSFLRAGVSLVWVAYPATKTVLVFRADGTAALRSVSDELSGEDVIPGFSCRVEDVFADL